MRRDPPVAISFSSSGREVFPVAADGTPLGPCLMTPDVRGDDVAARDGRPPQVAGGVVPPHRPRAAPDGPGQPRTVVARATTPTSSRSTRWFMNWHEFYALLLSGRPVVDWSDAGTWATYDVATGAWSAERIAETGDRPAAGCPRSSPTARRSGRSCRTSPTELGPARGTRSS